MVQINLTSSVGGLVQTQIPNSFAVTGLRAVSLASRADGDEGPREFGRGGGQVEQMLGRTARASIREGQPLHG
jgi:hypothetical protein